MISLKTNIENEVLSPVDEFYKNLPQYQEDLDILLNPDIKRRGRKRKNKMYFTPITEKAIVAYNIEENEIKRGKVYNEHMHYALWKLSQNIINRFKFPYMFGSTEDKQYEVIGFILQKLDKYTEEKGRAFSYFSIVAKNYCIQANNKAWAKLKSKADIKQIDYTRDLTNEAARKDITENLTVFMDMFVEYYDKSIESIYKTNSDKCIAYAIIDIFRDRRDIEKYNKKVLYLRIREITNESTQNISKVLSGIKKDYKSKYLEYTKN